MMEAPSLQSGIVNTYEYIVADCKVIHGGSWFQQKYV